MHLHIIINFGTNENYLIIRFIKLSVRFVKGIDHDVHVFRVIIPCRLISIGSDVHFVVIIQQEFPWNILDTQSKIFLRHDCRILFDVHHDVVKFCDICTFPFVSFRITFNIHSSVCFLLWFSYFSAQQDSSSLVSKSSRLPGGLMQSIDDPFHWTCLEIPSLYSLNLFRRGHMWDITCQKRLLGTNLIAMQFFRTTYPKSSSVVAVHSVYHFEPFMIL